MYCPSCGSDNQFAVKFCRRCGTSLEAVALALSPGGEEHSLDKSKLSQLIKDYYSGRHEMIGGLGAVGLGLAIPAALLAAGWWLFFWIFVWFCIGIFANGVRQFDKGWKKWSDASTDLKILGYDVPPGNKASSLPKGFPDRVKETRGGDPLQLSGDGAPPSVTESTTRQLDLPEKKVDQT
jgi:hypothetical protein